MPRKMFGSWQYDQCMAAIFCVLILNQQVVGKVEGRRRYESAFENLFHAGKLALKELPSFHTAVKGNKELHQTTTKVINFVKMNPDKVGLGVGLAASSWLLYQSIVLTGEVERFFNEIKELKGQFNQYYLQKVSKLEDLFKKTRDVMEADTETQREHFRDIYKELMKHYQDMQSIMDNVEDIIDDVNKARNDAVISTAASFTVAVLAGVALVMGGPIKVPPEAWKAGMSATIGMSSASTVLSLRNAKDLVKSADNLKVLKNDLRELRNHVMEKMMNVIQFT